MSDSILASKAKHNPAVWCGFCGGQSSTTDHYETDWDGTQRVEKSDMAWFPKLESYAHWKCVERNLKRLGSMFEGDVIEDSLADTLGADAATVYCDICGRLEETEQSWGEDHVPIFNNQVTQLHKHPSLQYSHASCALRVVMVLNHEGIPTTQLAKKLMLTRVHWKRKRKQLTNLPHWTPAIGQFLGDHIKERIDDSKP